MSRANTSRSGSPPQRQPHSICLDNERGHEMPRLGRTRSLTSREQRLYCPSQYHHSNWAKTRSHRQVPSHSFVAIRSILRFAPLLQFYPRVDCNLDNGQWAWCDIMTEPGSGWFLALVLGETASWSWGDTEENGNQAGLVNIRQK